MGNQIQVIQSLQDEGDVNNFLLNKQSLLVLPRLFNDIDSECATLGLLNSGSQIIFLEDEADYVKSKSIPCLGKDGMNLIGCQWLYIEWNRTQRKSDHSYGTRGRYYYNSDVQEPETYSSTADKNFEIVEKMQGVFKTLQKYIRKNYRKSKIGASVIYIGPHLNDLLLRGDACVILPNGKLVNT